MAEDVRTTISRSVRSSCSNDEDVTLAFDFFDEYCAMNEGTTTFEKPESPPGDSESYTALALTHILISSQCLTISPPCPSISLSMSALRVRSHLL